MTRRDKSRVNKEIIAFANVKISLAVLNLAGFNVEENGWSNPAQLHISIEQSQS